MFRYALLTVAAYQAVAGCVALLMFADEALKGRGSAGLLLAAAIAVLSLTSGVLLARKRPRGLRLASALQLAQVLYVSTPWIQYFVAMGVNAGAALVVRVGPVPYMGVNFSAHHVAAFQLGIGRPTDTVVVGINAVALAMWLGIRRARNTLFAQAEHAAAEPPLESGVAGPHL